MLQRLTVLYRLKSLAFSVLEVLGGALLLAVGGRCVIKTPFTPVPFTLQTMFLAILVLLLRRRAWRPVACYIALGLLGLPVFAFGGGLWYLSSPTFGYILGFLVAAIIVGRIVRRLELKWLIVYAITVNLIVYLLGVPWLACWLALTSGAPIATAAYKALVLGLLPFIGWDLLKAIGAALCSWTIYALHPLQAWFKQSY